tara:strand:- start:1369 stop:1800 length:432 start_codon:yes stop_codon:yes gene_type:complete
MNTERRGGNPIEDAKEAKIRFESVVKPTLENLGFTRISGAGYNMINRITNQIVMITSAPSNYKIVKSTKQLIRKYRKEYENPSITYLFTREISDYPQGGKDTYIATLNKISSMNLLSGVSTGISMLPNVVCKLKSNEQFRLIA